MSKLLLYCTKAKPYLNCDFGKDNHEEYSGDWNIYLASKENECSNIVNGEIVAECDFEVEWCDTSWCCGDFIEHKGLEKSCLTKEQLFDYVKGRNEFYAIHIKNLHIFDEPIKLEKCYNDSFSSMVNYAPQNMMYSWLWNNKWDRYILISIRPKWLCKILNGEKTIEVRKKVLKEMM